jgi:Xaa-Pro aminopeptidase
VVGEPTSEQEEIMVKLRATQDAGFAAIEPGRPASEVFEAVRAEFARQGLPFFMPHIGHGLGIGLHEFPMLEPQNHTPLEVGMVLNVEPMVVFRDQAECYHTEDLALVTPDGRELLTKPQDALIRIGA